MSVDERLNMNWQSWHQEKHDQQVWGGNSAALLCSHETSAGVLHPILTLLTQEGHGAVGEGPEKGCKNGQRAGAPPQMGQAERAAVLLQRKEGSGWIL